MRTKENTKDKNSISQTFGVNEVEFARTVLAHGNTWFGNRKNGGLGCRDEALLVPEWLPSPS